MTRSLFVGLAVIAVTLPSAAALSAGAKPQGMTLRCTGIPDFPKGKTVTLAPSQIHYGATLPEILFVEPDGAVGFTYYEMMQDSPKRLTGTAQVFSRSDWKRRTAKVVCTVIN